MSEPVRTMFKWQMDSRYDVADEKAKDERAVWLKVCAAVDARDKHRCRACGKPAPINGVGVLQKAHRHHIVYRSAGGQDVSSNLATLCARCHNDVHQSRLDIEGNADIALTFKRRDDDGAWYVSKQEIGVGLVERD
jgi:5-methylcytosine-specific restriction endonuclease McrA